MADEGGDHRRDLGPRVDAPPVPPENQHQPDARPRLENQLPRLPDAVQVQRDPGAQDHDAEGGHARGADVVGAVLIGPHEAGVDVVDEVGGAPVELGRHGRHERGREAAEHQPAPARGEVVADDEGVTGLAVGDVRIQDQRGEGGEHPRPRPHAVVGDGEPQRRQRRLPLVPRRHHALREVPAAARLLAGVPARPPLHAEIGHERGRRQAQRRRGAGSGRAGGRQHEERGLRKLLAEPRKAPDLRRAEGEVRDGEGPGHGEGELDEVGQHHAAQAGHRHVGAGQREAGEDRGQPRPPQGDLEDLGHREVDPADDHAVDRQPQVEGAEPAQEARGPPVVADLHELDVGEDARPPPQPREEQHAEHAAEGPVPPDPVAGDAVPGDDAGDREGGVGRERRRHHRRPREPPRQVAAGEEVLAQVPAGAPRDGQGDGGGEEQEAGEDQPVERRQGHGRRVNPHGSGRGPPHRARRGGPRESPRWSGSDGPGWSTAPRTDPAPDPPTGTSP